MSEIKIIGKGEKYAHASVGMMETINSKLFLKEQIDATSCEISFLRSCRTFFPQSLPRRRNLHYPFRTRQISSRQ